MVISETRCKKFCLALHENMALMRASFCFKDKIFNKILNWQKKKNSHTNANLFLTSYSVPKNKIVNFEKPYCSRLYCVGAEF